jgi:opacity protein-like surface antigen
MKKILLTTSAIILALGYIHEANADCNGLYLAGRGGVVKHEYSQKSGKIAQLDANGLDSNQLMLSGALGYRYDYFRAELEYVWRNKSEEKENDGVLTHARSFKTYSYMLNGYIDLAPYRWFTPYINAGIGFTKLKYSDGYIFPDGSKDSKTHDGNYGPTRFTWSVGGGLSIKVTNRFNVDAGYRYYDMGSIKSADITAHEVYGGIRYVF